MIAVFLPSMETFELMGRLLVTPTREVDGAWRYWRSDLGDRPLRVFLVEEGADSAYGAARVAIRRGAKVLVPVLEGVTSDALAERWELRLGSCVALRSVWDFGCLGGLLRVLPDSAASSPVGWPEEFPSRSVWRDAEVDGSAVGSLPVALRCRWLAGELERRTGCRIFDRQGAGYGAAAAEEAVMLKGMVWVGAVLSEGTIWELDEPTRLALLEDQFAGFLGMESRGTE